MNSLIITVISPYFDKGIDGRRKIYSADFKAKIVLEGGKALNEIASKCEILPKNLKNWRKQFLENYNFTVSTVKIFSIL